MEEMLDITKSPLTFKYVTLNTTMFLRHNACQNVVLLNTNGKSLYQCMFCDVDVFPEEVTKGPKHDYMEFERLLIETRDILLLDD